MRNSNHSGFTLIEMVAVMVIIGVLAIAAVSRFSNTSDFDARTFHDELISSLRYAQKAAIARGRNVCVTFAGSPSTSISFSVAPSRGDAISCSPGIALLSPTGVSPYIVTPRIAGISVNAVPADSFYFDALGKPRNGAGVVIGTKVFQVNGLSHNITIEQESGYVH